MRQGWHLWIYPKPNRPYFRVEYSRTGRLRIWAWAWISLFKVYDATAG